MRRAVSKCGIGAPTSPHETATPSTSSRCPTYPAKGEAARAPNTTNGAAAITERTKSLHDAPDVYWSTIAVPTGPQLQLPRSSSVSCCLA